MKNMLVVSSLALALMSGTALAQVSLETEGNAGVGVDATVGGSNANADVGANIGAAAEAAADDDELDAGTTAAVGAQGSVGAVLDTFDDDGTSFFTDDTRAEVRSQAEIETAFAQLSAEQQASLRAACAEGSAGGGGAEAEIASEAGLCVAINQMAQ